MVLEFWRWNYEHLANPEHNYASPGTYQVCLTTSTIGCLSDSVCKTIITCKENVSASVSGSIDESFGQNGFALVKTGAFDDLAEQILVQPDGKILTGGQEGLCRFLSDGILDPSFDGDGILQEWNWEYNHFALTSDGKIVVGSRDSDDFLMARYNSDGSLDPSFGTGGKVATDFSGNGEDDYIISMLIQPDGKILILGYYGFSADKSIVARYNPSGQLDVTFAGDGILKINVQNFFPADFILQPDGKMVLGGETEDSNFVLRRINHNGAPDPSFGVNSLAIIDFNGDYSSMRKLLLQQDGKIIAAGNVSGDFALVRFDANGNIDNGYGENGIASEDFFDSDVPTSAALQSDGKIVMTGYFQHSPAYDEIALLRFTSEGELDHSFGTNGVVSTLVNCEDSRATSLALSGNYIYVGGGRVIYSGESCVVRYFNGCEAPQELHVLNTIPTAASIDWNDVPAATSYKLRYKVSGSGSWQKTSSPVSEKQFLQLTPATKYTVQVKSNCTSLSGKSDWSEKLQFTTPPLKESTTVAVSEIEVYPNPFTDYTAIHLLLEKDEHVKIELQDVSGKMIKEIADEIFAVGHHEIIVEAQHLAAGAYLLCLKTSSSVVVRQIVAQ